MVNKESERKRLVELKRQFVENFDCGDCQPQNEKCRKCLSEKEADYFLDNGIVVPPVKVGQTVYYVSDSPINLSVQANTIYEAEVVRIVTTHLGTTLVIQIHNEYGCTEIPNIHEWQKTLFTSREDALKALEGSGRSEICIDKHTAKMV